MAKTQKTEKAVKARVLSKITIDGVAYEPDQIVEVDPNLIESLGSHVDPHPDAVAYIEGNK
jgi:hypothetical protein